MDIFNPSDWLPEEGSASQPFSRKRTVHSDQVRDVERVLEALEKQQLDITAEYRVWLQLGFAFAEGFGEAGREYFHRVSRFYPNYNFRECDKQYTYCLRSKGSGISLASFFFLAREAGIPIGTGRNLQDPYKGLEEVEDFEFQSPPKEESPDGMDIPAEVYAEEFIYGSKLKAPSHQASTLPLLPIDPETGERLRERRRMEMEKWRPNPVSEPAVHSVPKDSSEEHPSGSAAGALPAPALAREQTPRDSAETSSSSSSFRTPSEPSGASTPVGVPEEPCSKEPCPHTPLESSGAPAAVEVSAEAATEAPMPVFPEQMYEQLPQFLQRVVAPAETPEERDLLLLGCLGAVSACFPNLFGLYDGKEYRPNLFVFISAKASAGKGRLVHTKQLVTPLHRKYREEAALRKQEYETELALYNSGPGEKEGRGRPQKPRERMLFLPANSSATGIYQLLSDNDGRGLIHETEGDTLTQSLKSDFSNFGDGLRKVYHHETISYYRRTDREYVDIETPCLSVVLSGTPKQVLSLIPNAEDGLFSRFLFYHLHRRQGFKEVFATAGHGNLDAYYRKLGMELLPHLEQLETQPPIWVELTEQQVQRFYTYFRRALIRYRDLQPEEYEATVKRLGLTAFRLCMLLTAFRISEDGLVSPKLKCSDRDFESVLQMVSVLLRHSSTVFNQLPEELRLRKKANSKEQFLEQLPADFNRAEYLELAEKLKIGAKSAEAYIAKFVEIGELEHPGFNKYVKREMLAT